MYYIADIPYIVVTGVKRIPSFYYFRHPFMQENGLLIVIQAVTYGILILNPMRPLLIQASVLAEKHTEKVLSHGMKMERKSAFMKANFKMGKDMEKALKETKMVINIPASG